MRVVYLFIVIMLAFACDPFNTILSEEDLYYYGNSKGEMPDKSDEDTLKVMTWNVKFGGGRIDFFFDCHGDWVTMDSSEVLTNLTDMARFIESTRPDILFVQEIDVNSKRSAFVDQVEWLLKNAHFGYAVYAPQWKASHIPSEGLGKMDSGNAIFSVTPLLSGQRISLPLIEEQNFIVRYFYLRRNILDVNTVVYGDTLHLVTTHLSAYSSDGTKKKQLDVVFNYLDSLDKAGVKFVTGGDFNALPSETHITHDFPDSACEGDFEADDYSGEVNWMDAFYHRFNAAISLERYALDNTPFFTHTTDKNGFWNRKVDFIFSNCSFVKNSAKTYQSFSNGGFETMPLSDHCAVEGCVDFR
jgi:endonuclease/exonuclease/phosphatase family metal-dependent hydrolase